MTKLISRNTTIPTRKSQIFSTAADNQPAVTVHVLQGEREMAVDNRTLGKFDLSDIAPAPRGVPQIEVGFDIDANGIVHVSAKDLGTGKEQKIVIQNTGGLTEAELQRMVKDAESNAEADKRRRELIEARNQAEQLVYQTEKSLREHGDKVSMDVRREIETAVEDLKRARDGEDVAAIQRGVERLQQVSGKMGEEIYRQSTAGAAGGPGVGPGDRQAGPEPATHPVTVDAEYEVVDEDKDRSK
jgi:molecular chaperone DnaK